MHMLVGLLSSAQPGELAASVSITTAGPLAYKSYTTAFGDSIDNGIGTASAINALYSTKFQREPVNHQRSIALFRFILHFDTFAVMRQTHMVFSAKPGMSHLRPLCLLASKIASRQPVIISFLVANVGDIYDKLARELRRYQTDADEPCPGVIRLLAVGELVGEKSELEMKLGFRRVWKCAFDETPMHCHRTGAVFPPVPRPLLVLLDGFQYTWFDVVRDFKPSPPILQWMSMSPLSLLRFAGPPECGPMGDALRDFYDGKVTTAQVQRLETAGNIIKLPGIAPMYDWEFQPEELNLAVKENIWDKISRVAKFVHDADGFVTTWSVSYDREECLREFKAYVNSIRGRPAFHLGPLLPLIDGSADFNSQCLAAEQLSMPTESFEATMTFLDRIATERGARSLMYISFGSEHWPSSTERLYDLLMSLKAKDIPYILAHARCPEAVIRDLIAMFGDPRLNLFINWAPQQSILSHKACGVFLTHGGPGSTLEAATQSVPMICWPFPVDQADSTCHVVQSLEIGWELREVRSGDAGRRPVLATGRSHGHDRDAARAEFNRVLDEAFGPEGEKKREKARRLAEELGACWSPGGHGSRGLSDFLRTYCP
ncbi:UDP-Glycosyltransferase/glycogen phosphorylase [Sodiomyces alkalinus F11]|uniref:UDP-Glycosyltransferase/glycogen phosphorylase n=1 Tax=Sodiomyces alkalinus (strain CBS 110278 / VKM F-3762 / F11) TaxID=1314773 RepID=A0A3N2PSZ6_SODAK|nr:UDP-Glycosyltransferase/glycogen phosphorylase [Sodiomyces alkalinus F11]ROT37642.1 UDP-Glycosyltransferase/glycogen phosphorylase [Sodiomyces alkalinus F11]